MAKIDIISLSGLTAIDGSIVLSGATVKFETQFFIGSTIIEIRPRTYRSVELFEQGFQPVLVHEIPNDYFRINLNGNEFYSITPLLLYQRVMDYLNNHVGYTGFEIITII